ncbi:MAG: ABC transporter substrate-binding protein [Deltaproteobacteria bacterium]|nr:ABC transporter substrate-binding protein [Deltaproteobacteria bacterium]
MQAEVGVTEDKIVIGSLGPLTGPIAMVGTSIAAGAKDYFDQVNEQGGIHGRKIVFISEDDKYDPSTAMAALKKLLVRDKIFALSSTSGTPITAALSATIEKEQLPSMCTIAASAIFYPKPPKNIFSFGPFYSENTIFNVEYILNTSKVQKPKLAFFYQDDEFGQESELGLQKAVEKYGLEVVVREKYSRTAIDISSQVYNIKKAKPDFLLAATIPSHTIMLLKEAKKAGLDIPIFAVSNTRFESVISASGDAAANFYVTEYTSLPHESQFPGIASMMQAWKKGNAEGVPTRYYQLSRVNAILMVEAMRRCGKDLTREKFRKELEALTNFENGGITGRISYGPNERCPLTAMRMLKANPQKGIFEAITDWGSPKLRLR